MLHYYPCCSLSRSCLSETLFTEPPTSHEMPSIATVSSKLHTYSSSSSAEPVLLPPTLFDPDETTTTSVDTRPTSSGLSSLFNDPMYQLFGVVVLLFVLTLLLGLVNFCIWYIEKRQRSGPVHWRSAPIVDLSVTGSRPVAQPPKRSFHIQHALYKSVRRPSSMPP